MLNTQQSDLENYLNKLENEKSELQSDIYQTKEDIIDLQSSLTEHQESYTDFLNSRENTNLELFNIRNNIEDINTKILSIIQSHKRSFNIDIDQLLNNLESNRMEC